MYVQTEFDQFKELFVNYDLVDYGYLWLSIQDVGCTFTDK